MDPTSGRYQFTLKLPHLPDYSVLSQKIIVLICSAMRTSDCVLLTLGLWNKKLPTLTVLGTFCTHTFLIIFSTFFFWSWFCEWIKDKNYFYASFSFLMQLCRMKYIKFLRTENIVQIWNVKEICLYYDCTSQFSHLFELSWQSGFCTPILSTGNISSLFFCL